MTIGPTPLIKRGKAAGRAVSRWRSPAATWLRGIPGNPKRAALAGIAVILLPVAIIAPISSDEVAVSVGFSLAFLATLLTGEAVIFALSFSPSSSWPSLREIDGHIAFREWVVVGWLGAMLTAGGLLTQATVPAVYGGLLFLLANVFGMFSFIRLFGLASSDGRKRLLQRTLEQALESLPAPPLELSRRMPEDRVVSAYLGQLDDTAARSDGNGVRELAAQLSSTAHGAGGPAALALHLDVMQRLAKSVLAGALDPLVATAAAESLVESLLARVGPAPHPGARRAPDARVGAAAMAAASRYLAWMSSTALTLATRGVTMPSPAREMIAFGVRARETILHRVDPDPKYISGSHDLGTPLTDPVCVLTWINGFTEFHGSSQAAGFYSVYEILTGTKFLGNYWDGDSILAKMREALFSSSRALAVDTQAASSSRQAFGTVGEFDRIWTLMSVNAIATYRNVTVAHPPELIRPEFTPDPQLLGAYLRTFASHRYFTSAQEAMTALTRIVGVTDGPAALWPALRVAQASFNWIVPIPQVEPHHRPSACVLAIASRLAPLTAGESDRELRSFLRGLPDPVLEATASLAARTLPDPDGQPAGTASPDRAEAITQRLRVLQLVGVHRSQAVLS
jgi:hypothetical protein